MGRLGWDQETVMPPRRGCAAGRGDGRARGRAACAPVRSADRGASGAGGTRDGGRGGAASADRAGACKNRQDPGRSGDRTGAGDIHGAGGSGRWRGQMTTSMPFLPTLAHVLRLKRVEAEALADGGDLYDALIDDYEPGMTAAELGALFRPDAAAAGGSARPDPRGGAGAAGAFGAFPARRATGAVARDRAGLRL